VSNSEPGRTREQLSCSAPARKILPIVALPVLLALAALSAECMTEPGGMDAATISPINGTYDD